MNQSEREMIRKNFASKWLALVLFVAAAVVYVSNTWSPSSYAHVLQNHLGYQDVQPDFGKARPIRSDEWAVVTALTQATVRNDFKRYNETSLYREDLRINYGLPIWDWGMAFKPTMWLYGHADPAYAYSVHWFAIFALFIVGYFLIFREFGADTVVAGLLSFGLFFTGYGQFWWNEKGPLFAIFPWVVLPFFWNIRFALQLALFYYLAVFWFLTNLYPPIQISLAFVGAVILVAKKPEIFKFRKLLCVAFVAALAAATAAFYLYDYLSATSKTLYPGGRTVSGGDVPFRFVLSWFFPRVNFTQHYESLIGLNICEIGTVGLYYYLFVLGFLDYKNFGRLWGDRDRRKVFVILSAAFLLMLLWMLAPIPPQFGRVFLWDNVQPSRMQFASGVLLTLLAFHVAGSVGFVFTIARVLVIGSASVLAWAVYKYPLDNRSFGELAVVLAALLLYGVHRGRARFQHESVVLCSTLGGLLIFGAFNPLQSAQAIFHSPPNESTRYFQHLEQANGGVLATMGLPGATANGLGFRSVSHVTAVPNMQFWKASFPELPPDELNAIFNRYSHLVPELLAKPRVRQPDLIEIPLERFRKLKSAVAVPSLPADITSAGHFSIEKADRAALLLSGWGAWAGPVEGRAVEFISRPAIEGEIKIVPIIRGDLPKNTGGKISVINGFKLLVPVRDEQKLECLTLISLDASNGVRNMLHNPPDLPACKSGAS